MVPVVSFVGNSGAGKTTILEKTVRELKGRGYRVAVIKHAHHDFQIDYPGKDSWRFSQAGSDVVVISSPVKMAMVEPRSEEPSLDELIALVEEKADIILTEGFRQRGKPQVLVMRAAQSAEVSKEEIEPLAIVSDYPFDSAQGRPVDSPVPRFDFDDVARLTDFLIVHLHPSPPSPK